jgi:cysteinyl-tRNA synthetase
MRLHNTLTRTVEEFVPRDQGRVGLYVCGPTVQNVPHFGHARAELLPDLLRRYLEWRGLQVFHVRNITDIDDKIIARAEFEGRPAAAIAQEYGRIFEREMERFGLLPPHVVPRATGHVIEMLELIDRLVELGSAYEAGGDVFFAVRSFERYGRLSGRQVDDLRVGARVEADERKRDPLDFAMWKAAKPGEPSWPSTYGPGRPGWHIECSAMASKYLGAGFDVHGGGLDLIFPHHENEIAQYEAATGRAFARYWLHNGLLTVGEEKMSKSLGNFLTLSNALDRYGPARLRFFYLAVHYRSPVEFSEQRLADASTGLKRWDAFLRATAAAEPTLPTDPESQEFRQRFGDAMDDDLSTPRAQAVLFDLVSAGNAHLEAGRADRAGALRAVLLELAGVLGYALEAEPSAGEADLVGALVEALLVQRAEARERRDFTSADGIRTRLSDLGVVVEDRPEGVRWHLAGR